MEININENGLHLVIEIGDAKDVRLLHFSSLPFDRQLLPEKQRKKFRLVEIHVSGENQDDHHGSKHTGTMPGNRLQYQTHRDYYTQYGRKIEIAMVDSELMVVSHLQLFNNIPIVRSWTEIINNGEESKGLEYVSSFTLTGIAREGMQTWEQKSRVHIPHNTWFGESQWKQYSLPELGLSQVNEFSMKRLSFSNTGTWSTSQYLPMGCFENTECGTCLFWQIEHHGSWHWEISSIVGQLYLQLSGPTENENHWWKKLEPVESFVSVPVVIGVVVGSFEKAIQNLTRYRRLIRRPNQDNETLPIIFNDYMNCLFGDPTTEKLFPLIDAAAKVGCEYFCIDAGWYSDGEWWDGVGEWQPSKSRFPGGIREPLDYIRDKGMIPGLWLELEVMGINCSLAKRVPDEWFFIRHGKRVADHGRYQLDFRNSEVRGHADRVISRLVDEYGVGYIKMDYNINAGIGTELYADSVGAGLLEHNRAYLDWLDNIFKKYPELVIENCSSGGMRMDYALLSRHSIQSSSDQTDYRKYAAIAAASATAVTPEQCAVWSYPLREGDNEEVIFNMVNVLLLRVHQSGHLAEISSERLELVQEGLNFYKTIRQDIKVGVPFWPLGLPSFRDSWISWGLRCGRKTYLAVWRMECSSQYCRLPIGFLKGKKVTVRFGYPAKATGKFEWYSDQGELSIYLPKELSARLLELEESIDINDVKMV
jgi:alpha-galactosidase